MLQSPYNIPGIGTPLHQPEEDQQILPNALQQQHQQQQAQQQQQHSVASLGSSPLAGFAAQLMGTPQRTMHTYAPTASYATPQQMMQPQTPVCLNLPFLCTTANHWSPLPISEELRKNVNLKIVLLFNVICPPGLHVAQAQYFQRRGSPISI